MRNNEILGIARCIYFVSFFLKLLQINNNIRYLLAVQKKNQFYLNILLRKPLENYAFCTPPCLQNGTYENKID